MKTTMKTEAEPSSQLLSRPACSTQAKGKSTRSPYFSSPRPMKRRTMRYSSGKTAVAVMVSLAGHLAPTAEGLAAATSPVPLPSNKRGVVTPADVSISSTNNVKQPKKAQSRKKNVSDVPRTESFGALWAGSFPDLDQNVKPHTLILGTHPSIKSLAQEQYYGHPMNAFWWIAGDCLGFRRGTAISPSSGKPYKFSSSLKYGHEHIIPYDQQIRQMVADGFCVWDVVESCQRPGSLDQAIKEELPNDIRGFCQQNESIRRIVLANGGTGSSMFVKHFRDWFQSGELVAADHEQSQKAFGRAIAKGHASGKATVTAPLRTITLISALSVSPAAATYSYETKRAFWAEHVYRPGLADALDVEK